MNPIILILLGSIFAVLSDPIPDQDRYQVSSDQEAEYFKNVIRMGSNNRPARPLFYVYPPVHPLAYPPVPYLANYLRSYPYYDYYNEAPVHADPYPHVHQTVGENKKSGQEGSMVIDESLSDKEAIEQLLAWKEENERDESLSRFLLPSITINSTTITITRTSFLSLLSSLTVSITTKTILVPGLSIG